MTVLEFQRRFPQFAHLEGYQLWDKMEDVLLLDAKDASEEDIKKFFELPYLPKGTLLESYKMYFIDQSDWNEEDIPR